MDCLTYPGLAQFGYNWSVVRTFGLVGVLLLAAGTAQPEERLTPEQAAALSAIRAYALDYTARLPDYTCIQVTKRRTVVNRGTIRPAHKDVIVEQLTFSNHRESYQVLKFNGEKAIGVEHNDITGAMVSGEFGRLLSAIFDPQSGTTFQFEGAEKLQGRKMTVIAYRVPDENGMQLTTPAGSALVGLKGQVRADAETNQVMQITAQSTGVPAGFQVREVRLALEYKAVPVAGQQYTLPFHCQAHWRNRDSSVHSEIDYTQYRKFVSEATLKFDGDDSAK